MRSSSSEGGHEHSVGDSTERRLSEVMPEKDCGSKERGKFILNLQLRLGDRSDYPMFTEPVRSWPLPLNPFG